MASSSRDTVPYFVRRLDSTETTSCHRAQALFTVPHELVASLIIHPVLCRGSAFALEHDTTIPRTSLPAKTFVSTMLESPDPDATAQAIAERLATRVAHTVEHRRLHGEDSSASMHDFLCL